MSENKMENIRNHFCEGEIEAFKICNDIGQRNYRNSQRFKKEGESFPLSGMRTVRTWNETTEDVNTNF